MGEGSHLSRCYSTTCSSIQASLNSKASPLHPKSWIQLSMCLDGRDKITKLLQYICRFLAWYWTTSKSQNNHNPNNNHATLVSWQRCALLLYKQLAFSRKAFRLGRSLVELEKLHSMKHSLYQTVKDYAMNPSSSGTSSSSANDHNMTSLLMTWGSAIKTLGLAGFWAADNINFLTTTGCLDDFPPGTSHTMLSSTNVNTTNDNQSLPLSSASLTRKQQQERRVYRQNLSSIWANRCYFYGSIAGLVANFVVYRNHTLQLVEAAQEQDLQDEGSTSTTAASKSRKPTTAYQYHEEDWIRAKEKQWALFFMLIKSMADVLVFSNNPGLDIWQNLLGYKLHEGVHCMGGIISASVVLYNNFPSKK